MTKHEDHMTTTSVTAASSAERLESEVPQQWIPPSTIPMIAGGLGGIVSTTLLLPLDIVKLRLQVTEGSADPHRRFRHFRSLRIIGGIWKYEGLVGFYQGWTPAVLGSSISWGGYFFFYEGMKRQYMQYCLGRGSSDLTSAEHFVLACGAGAIMVGLTNPIWLVKTRMQLQLRRAQQSHSTIPPYRNMFDAFSTIVREEGGWKALYKGAGPALLLTSHGGVQFVVYEYLRKHPSWFQWSSRATSNDTSVTPKTVWLRLEQSAGYLTMGALAKIAATTATYPLQLIKTRMQQRMNSMDLADDQSVRFVQRGDSYSTLWRTMRTIYTNEGLSGFFKGCFTNALRVAPGAAITFVVYEAVTDALTTTTV